jgi:hypothetical protein
VPVPGPSADGLGRVSCALGIGYRGYVAAILTLMIVLTLSLVVTRAATIALTATGMSREAARFQARSAFSGAGFTTTESESVVRHPVRRRIIMWLMLAGSAGIIAVIASVVLAASQPDGDAGALMRVAVVCGGIVLIWWASRTRWVDERITRLATAGLRRWTQLEVHDYASLLHVGGEYVVNELQVEDGSWVAGRDLESLRLRDEGIVVLGIERVDGSYLGVPTGDSRIEASDVLVVYSRSESIAKLDQRQRGHGGDAAHIAAVREQAAAIAESQAEPEDSSGDGASQASTRHEEHNGSSQSDK